MFQLTKNWSVPTRDNIIVDAKFNQKFNTPLLSVNSNLWDYMITLSPGHLVVIWNQLSI